MAGALGGAGRPERPVVGTERRTDTAQAGESMVGWREGLRDWAQARVGRAAVTASRGSEDEGGWPTVPGYLLGPVFLTPALPGDPASGPLPPSCVTLDKPSDSSEHNKQ